jgi:DNA-binding IscR family transcriptional regulator
LGRRPSEITALEVIRTIDGPVFLTSCSTGSHGGCGVSDKCNVREPLRKVHDGIQSLLAGITIADMCDEEEELTPACAPPPAAHYVEFKVL